MFEPQQQQQHFVDLQENSSFGNSWLSGDHHDSSPSHRHTQSSLATSATASGTGNNDNGNVDRVLFNDLVAMVPLVQSLIDRKANSSFTKRGSVIYTKTPSRESLHKKIEQKGRNNAQSIPAKKKKDRMDKDQGNNVDNNADADDFAMFPSSLTSERDREELITLRAQVEDLQKKLQEKDELLKSAEMSVNQMNGVYAKLDTLNSQFAEKDTLMNSINSQLSDAKIKLADKQAALEKIQWEAMTSNTKVEKLQEELKSSQRDVSSFMLLLEGLAKSDFDERDKDYSFSLYQPESIPYIDDLDEKEMQKMEEARQAYVAAVAVAKERQDEESIAAAASARLHLQSFVFRT